jgi:hypothetical protein
MHGGWGMRKFIHISVAAVFSILIIAHAYAENGKGRGGERTPASRGIEMQNGDGHRKQQQAKRLEKAEIHQYEGGDAPCYISSDGEKYVWRRRFNRRLMKFEEKGNSEAMNRYLNRIANRYRFGDGEEAEKFREWARENRPWHENQHTEFG